MPEPFALSPTDIRQNSIYDVMDEAMASSDCSEGVAAFVEKTIRHSLANSG